MQRPILIVLFIFLITTGNAQINMVVKDGGFLFMEGKDSIFFYQKNPKSKDGAYSRCHYIHPLYAPDGTWLTEDFPSDHLHHRGIFWAWHQILIDGKQVADGWELKNFQQKVTNFEFRSLKGKGFIATTVDWRSSAWKSGDEAYLREDTRIIIHPLVGNYRRIDFEIKLNALVNNLSIGGSDDVKGYSGFSVRTKLPENVQFTGIKGLVESQNTAVEAGNFIKIGGAFLQDEKSGGVVMWSDLQNPSPATSWILRKKASMQNAAFPGRKPVAIPFDQPLLLKYSLLVFEGDMSHKHIKKALK
jgi:hypothetical protein